MIVLWAIGSLLAYTSLTAAEDDIACEKPAQKIIIPMLRGIVLLGSSDKLQESGLTQCNGLHVFDLEIPGGIEQLEREVADRFLDQPLRSSSLAAIKRGIALYFQRHNQPLQAILVPGQNTSHGVLQIVLVEGKDLSVADDAWPQEPLPPPPSPLLPPPPPPAPTVMIPKLEGIVLLGDSKLVGDPSLDALRGISLQVELPTSAKDLELKLIPFLGRPLREVDVRAIKRKILAYFREAGRPIVSVQIPEQEITSGVLKVLIIQGKLGEVRVRGNRWTKSRRLENYIRLEPGKEIDETTLREDLALINRNPFRRVDAIYTPGLSPHTTDIELLTHDRRPWRLYAGSENSGVEPTGRTRVFAGFNWGNAFNLDHILSYQYTAATEWHKFYAHTGQYTALLPWRHIGVVYGGYSRVHPDLHIKGSRGSGYGIQTSLRYDIPLEPTHSFTHEFFSGLDFKRTNNVIEFIEEPDKGQGNRFFGSNVNLTQVALGYTFTTYLGHLRSSFEVEMLGSPAQWLSDQSNADFRTLRPFAHNTYMYGRFFFTYLYQLPKEFVAYWAFRGQFSSTNLLPSEQFGIGGYNTVRGYEERALNADNAFLANIELRTPPMHLLSYFGCKKWSDTLQLLAFLDYGMGSNHKLLRGEPGHSFLWGIGPGLRYALDPYLSFRLDWGFPLHEGFFGGHSSRVYFGVTASY